VIVLVNSYISKIIGPIFINLPALEIEEFKGGIGNLLPKVVLKVVGVL